MHTSYFAKYKGIHGISIALKNPQWFNGESYPDLFPEKSFLFKYFKDHDKESYAKSYYDQVLSKLNPEQVYNDLHDKVLLCYEKTGEFCHRYLVADWIFENLQIKITEL